MKKELQDALLECETDIQGSIQRFYGNEDIYISYLKTFPDEPTMKLLRQSIEDHQWEEAFVTAHALKGLAGNLGFIPLYHALGELVVMLRAGKYGAVDQLYEQTEICYDEIVKAIRNRLN
ncbi:MAG: Hpt domain-containing protein [bacterium]|nr:Hpt domain-containing protein [bacterium]